MALCPDGHQSSAADYCDECGLAMAGGSGGGAAGLGAPGSGAGYGGGLSATLAMPAGEPCPNCLLPRTDDPFCEGCGFDFANAAPVAPPVTQTAPGPVPGPPPAPPIDIEEQLRLAEEAARAASAGAGAGAGVSSGGVVSGGASTAGVPTGGGGGSQNPFLANGSGSNAATQGVPVFGADPAAGGAPAGAGSAAAPVAGPATGTWVLIAEADRAYYDSVVADGEIDADAYPFPPYCPERRFPISGDNVRIGRSSTSRGAVEVDLTGPPTDPGVSHLNSVLLARPDGGWSVLDPGSMNGTVLNTDTAPIPKNQAIPIEEGHRIHVGVWTTLTLRRG